MIPIDFLSKLGVYEFQSRGVTLKVRVADTPATVDIGVSELKSVLSGTSVVGVKIHYTPLQFTNHWLLELCVGTRCLIVQMAYIRAIPESLETFLVDKEICFVGVKMSSARSRLGLIIGIEVSELVARYLKKPNLSWRGLEELAREVGVDLQGESAASGNVVSVNWAAKIFSEEEIKYAVRDVQACYLIGKKIFG